MWFGGCFVAHMKARQRLCDQVCFSDQSKLDYLALLLVHLRNLGNTESLPSTILLLRLPVVYDIFFLKKKSETVNCIEMATRGSRIGKKKQIMS